MNQAEMTPISEYFKQKPDNQQAIARVLMETILAGNEKITADIRWGKPTFGLNSDFHHWICAIQITKKKVCLIFHFGGLLEDKNNRFIAGTSRFMRKLEYDGLEQIDQAEIQGFISQAIETLPYFKENWQEINRQWKAGKAANEE